MIALLLFGSVFGVQLDLFEKKCASMNGNPCNTMVTSTAVVQIS